MARIIMRDNFDRPGVSERFVDLPPMLNLRRAKEVAEALNESYPENHDWYYVGVEDSYKLKVVNSDGEMVEVTSDHSIREG